MSIEARWLIRDRNNDAVMCKNNHPHGGHGRWCAHSFFSFFCCSPYIQCFIILKLKGPGHTMKLCLIKIRVLCNLLYVLILFQNTGSQLCFRLFCAVHFLRFQTYFIHPCHNNYANYRSMCFINL